MSRQIVSRQIHRRGAQVDDSPMFQAEYTYEGAGPVPAVLSPPFKTMPQAAAWLEATDVEMKRQAVLDTLTRRYHMPQDDYAAGPTLCGTTSPIMVEAPAGSLNVLVHTVESLKRLGVTCERCLSTWANRVRKARRDP